MKYAAPVRKQLGFRTIFNLLGPLTNPAGADFQLIGTGRVAIAQKSWRRGWPGWERSARWSFAATMNWTK